ncbi:hypothetical protein L1987_22001 [Smallanthus sonchifolius]|uniref:Uncharacterized protein n=1 Tax=Smallanthus sonchifolius TaxID=185202 RepID=A0ACB9ICX8_9ASTR|nr:hypothetical protein L1987_22001 [Smallanthus sonchifolius]
MELWLTCHNGNGNMIRMNDKRKEMKLVGVMKSSVVGQSQVQWQKEDSQLQETHWKFGASRYAKNRGSSLAVREGLVFRVWISEAPSRYHRIEFIDNLQFRTSNTIQSTTSSWYHNGS